MKSLNGIPFMISFQLFVLAEFIHSLHYSVPSVGTCMSAANVLNNRTYAIGKPQSLLYQVIEFSSDFSSVVYKAGVNLKKPLHYVTPKSNLNYFWLQEQTGVSFTPDKVYRVAVDPAYTPTTLELTNHSGMVEFTWMACANSNTFCYIGSQGGGN